MPDQCIDLSKFVIFILFFVVVVGSPFESKFRWNVAWMLLYKIYILNVLRHKNLTLQDPLDEALISL
jgi:hypothetical protein